MQFYRLQVAMDEVMHFFRGLEGNLLYVLWGLTDL
jgi:hypothetical protein